MNTYFRSIVLTVAIGHLLLMLIGELGGEHSKRTLHYLYGVILLLTLFAPIRTFVKDISEMVDDIRTIFTMEGSFEQSQNEAVTDSVHTYVAARFVDYISEQYEIPKEDICITIHTDEEDGIQQIEIGLRNCYYALRRTIAEELQGKADIPITVKGW